MLDEVLRNIKNYFVKKVYKGEFTIADGNVQDMSDYLQNEQYFKIVGSVFNDGVYQYPQTELKAETFVGEIWAMAIPKEFLTLVSEIDAWIVKYGDDAQKPYQSESFGGYSYTKGSSYSGSSSNGSIGWQDIFKSRLNRWRKI